MLASGAHVDAVNKLGDTPLHEACQHGHTEVVQMLLNSGKCSDPALQDSASPKRCQWHVHPAASVSMS